LFGSENVTFRSENETFTGAYLIMLVYRHLLTITLTWQSSCVITIKNICSRVLSNIAPVIDRGVFHNYVHVLNNLFCVWRNQVKLLQSIVTSFVNFSPFYKGIQEKGKEWWIKGETMAQWINLLQNSSFIN